MIEDNRFGTELYSSTLRLAKRVGRSYCTVQRRIHKLVREDKVLILIRPANEPASLHNGEFRPTNTYRIAVENLKPRESVEEWEARVRPYAKHKGRHPTVEAAREEGEADAIARSQATSSTAARDRLEVTATQPAHNVSASTFSHATSEHRSPERAPQPKMSKRDCEKFVADMKLLMRGHTEDGFGWKIEPGAGAYAAPMGEHQARAELAKRWHRTEESVIEALKFWGYRTEDS